jgi:hypothetical protein
MADQKPDNEKGMTFTAKVRILEAVCGIDYPTDEEHNFRLAIMKSLGLDLKLAEVRNVTITGPGGATRRAQRT